LNSLLEQPQKTRVDTVIKTLIDAAKVRGFKSGFEIAFERGKRKILLTLLQARFPNPSESERKRVEELPAARIEDVAVALLTAQSFRDLGLEG
jgi:Domain of unknown function (DUF4351)